MVWQPNGHARPSGEIGQFEVAAALDQHLAGGFDDPHATHLRALRWLCHFVPKVNSIQYGTPETALSKEWSSTL
jgi:hypothetical protein